jgi:nitrite reductase/ring-hydroxylating ferredoxin subunit
MKAAAHGGRGVAAQHEYQRTDDDEHAAADQCPFERLLAEGTVSGAGVRRRRLARQAHAQTMTEPIQGESHG